MAVSPDGSYILTSDSANGVLHVICAVSNKYLRDITTVTARGNLTFSKDGKFVFLEGYGPSGGGIYKISTSSWTVTGFAFSGGDAGLVLSPDGKRLYAAARGAFPAAKGAGVTEIDTADMRIISFTERPYYSENLSITPDGKSLYVLEAQFGVNLQWKWRYEILDTTTLNTLTTFAYSPDDCALQPFDVGFTPDGKSAYLNIRHGIVTYSLPDLKQTRAFRFDGAQVGIAFLPWK